MTIITTGIDLEKNVFVVHGVTASRVARGKLNTLITALPPGAIGMEVCPIC